MEGEKYVEKHKVLEYCGTDGVFERARVQASVAMVSARVLSLHPTVSEDPNVHFSN